MRAEEASTLTLGRLIWFYHLYFFRLVNFDESCYSRCSYEHSLLKLQLLFKHESEAGLYFSAEL